MQDTGEGTGSTPAGVVLGRGLNALGVARSLGRNGVPVFVADPAPDDIAYRSRYAEHAPLPGHEAPEAQVAALLDLAARLGNRPVLIPTSDRALGLVLDFRTRLRDAFRFLLADDAALRTVLDKGEFARFTRAHDLPAPASHVPSSSAEVERLGPSLSYPVVLKPTLSYAWEHRGRGVERAEGPADLLRLWNERDGAALVVQEMIEGADDRHYSFCVYRDGKARELAAILVNKIRVFPVGGGAGTFLRTARDDAMEAIGRRAIEEIGLVGATSVCFKRDKRTGRPLIHEINGRLPQWHAIFQACGVDLPHLMYRDQRGETVAPQPICAPGTSFVLLESDLLALRRYRRAGVWSLGRWLGSLRGLGGLAEFARDDRGPFRFALRRLARAAWARLSGRKAASDVAPATKARAGDPA